MSEETNDRPVPNEPETPDVQDASEPEPINEVSGDDDADLLEGAARSLDGGQADGEAAPTRQALVDDSEGDAEAVLDDQAEGSDGSSSERQTAEAMAHHVAMELKEIEQEVRALLEVGDPRRKRKLSGSRRWRELEEDIINWHHGGRINQDALARLQQLIARRHRLFHKLSYLAATRPTWNT